MPTRRQFLTSSIAPAALALGPWTVAGAQPRRLAPTPACPGDATPPQTAGPYWKPRSPRRTSLLEPGTTGPPLVVTGRVLSTDCRPVAGALLDVWHCDARGEYDNRGQRLRGHQFTAEDGGYRLETIVPGLYPGRTRHVHVKVQAPRGPVLTTQLYFPDEPANHRDPIFDAALVIQVEDGPAGRRGAFDFVLRT